MHILQNYFSYTFYQLKGVTGHFFLTTSCQITNFKHFSLKNVVFYLNGGQGACPLKLKHFLNHKLQDSQFETSQSKNVEFYLNGGQGAWACPLKRKHFLKHKLRDNQFQVFQPEKCVILPQWRSGGLPPEAEVFSKSQVAR